MTSSASISIAQMAQILDRSDVTIREWIRRKVLPEDLRPSREGGRQKLVWSPEQVEGMRAFAEERGSRRGWQHPSPAA